MPFRFSLASVLKYRQALEQRHFLALERVQTEIASLEMQIQKTEGDRSAMEKRRADELRRGMASIHLQEAVEQELALERHRDDLAKKRHDLVLKKQELFKAYEQARQKRELMERLRNRKLAAYTREQAKAEQATIDDLFLARRKQME